MEFLGYIAAIFMGISLGMIGGGGSILTVPILVYLFAVDPVLATAYSLFVVGLTALVGGLTYWKRGEVDLKTGFVFAVPSFVGVYLTRAFVVPSLPDPVFVVGAVIVSKALLIMIVFAVLMLAASISMIRTRTAVVNPRQFSAVQKITLISLEGLVVGGVTGFVGAGGGFLIIPALVLLVGMPMKIAVGTSLVIIAAKSLIGFVGDLQQQISIDWPLLLTLSAIAVGGLVLGTILSSRVSEKRLKQSFGYFVLLMGTFVLLDQLRRL